MTAHFVWVLMEIDYDHFDVLGVYSTRTLAAKAMRESRAKVAEWRSTPYEYEIKRYGLTTPDSKETP